MLTTSPTEFLGTVHDRAPLIVHERSCIDWLDGDVAQARALTGIPPDSHDFAVRDIDEAVVVQAQPAEPDLFDPSMEESGP